MKAIYYAFDGKKFNDPSSCEEYERDLISFSFDKNIVLSELGERLLPQKPYEIKQAMNLCFFVEFKSVEDKKRFVALAKTCDINFDYSNILNRNQQKEMRYVWYGSLKRFMPINLTIELLNDANDLLESFKRRSE